MASSQSPIFPWDFRDSYASIKLPPSLFVTAGATRGECLNEGVPSDSTYLSERGGGARKIGLPIAPTASPLPLPSVV